MDSCTLLRDSPKTKYFNEFLSEDEATELFHILNILDGWKKNEYNGNKLNRETIVFASDDIVNNLDKYKIPDIWGKDVTILIFPDELITILDQLYELTGTKYNIALGNRYLKSKDGIAFHSDNEEFGDQQSISSLSLGVVRSFTFISKKDKDDKKKIYLENGSLVYMGEQCQENYTHGMIKEKIEHHNIFDRTRINVTFRLWNYSDKMI